MFAPIRKLISTVLSSEPRVRRLQVAPSSEIQIHFIIYNFQLCWLELFIANRDSPHRNFVVPINVVFESKSHIHHIRPKDENDYQKTTSYYVLWYKCLDVATVCKSEISCQESWRAMYECQIFGLGCKLFSNFIFCTWMVNISYHIKKKIVSSSVFFYIIY